MENTKVNRPTVCTPGYIWLQPEEQESAAECGCLLLRRNLDSDDPAITLCDLHSNAADLADHVDSLLRFTAEDFWDTEAITRLLGELRELRS